MQFISVMAKLIFGIITSVFSVTWSFSNHSIWWFDAQETFLCCSCFVFLWKPFLKILWE